MKIVQVIFGAMTWLLGTTITIFLHRGGWFTTFASLFTDEITIILYWFGLWSLIIGTTIIMPIIIIIDAYKETDTQ